MGTSNRRESITGYSWTATGDDDIRVTFDPDNVPALSLEMENNRQRLRYTILLDFADSDFLETVADKLETFTHHCRNVIEHRQLAHLRPGTREYQAYDDQGYPAGTVIVEGPEVRA